MQAVSVTATEFASLAGLTAVGGLFVAAKIHLYKNSVNPSKTSILADFEEATYTGYLAQAIGTFGAPYVAVDGKAHITAPGLQFQPTDAVDPNTIFGAFWTNTAGTILLAAVRFDEPVALNDATTGLVYKPDFIYGS